MTEQIKNNAASTLSAAITSTSATTCTVANGTVFPATGNFRILIDSELILVGARSGNTLSSMTRGIESTVAATHSNGAAVTHVLTTGGLDQYIRENALSLVPAARVHHNANQSITTATATVLALNSERYDTDTIHDTSTNNSRLTCKTAGKYAVKANIAFAANATGARVVELLLNGATVIGRVTTPGTAAVNQDMSVAADYDLAVNDYVEVRVTQDSGGNLNVLVQANWSPEVSMVRVA